MSAFQWFVYKMYISLLPITVAVWALKHELSSLAGTLGSWVRIPLKTRMSVLCAFFCVCVVLCVGRDLATG
jgi:hypothetical protein